MKANSFLQSAQKVLYAYSGLCAPLLEELAIPKVSFDILMFLANNPEYCTAQEISEIRHIRKNLISVHVEKLVNAGLLTRSPVEGDRRKIALSCTEKAEPVVAAGRSLQKRFFEELTAGINEEQWESFRTIQMTIETNAERMANGDEKERSTKTC